MRPRILLAVGKSAGNGLLGKTSSLANLRGSFQDFYGLPIVVTYHPAALLRNPQWKRPTWEDVKLLRTRYDQLRSAGGPEAVASLEPRHASFRPIPSRLAQPAAAAPRSPMDDDFQQRPLRIDESGPEIPFAKMTGGRRPGNVVSLREGAGRMPPQAVDVEQAVLGAVLIERDAIPKAIEILPSDAFYDGRHQKIYEAVEALFERGHPVDLITLSEELKRRGEYEAIGGYYLAELTTRVASAANVEYHARIIAEKSLLRKLITTMTGVVGQAFDPTTDAFDLLDEAERQIFQITETQLRKGVVEHRLGDDDDRRAPRVDPRPRGRHHGRPLGLHDAGQHDRRLAAVGHGHRRGEAIDGQMPRPRHARDDARRDALRRRGCPGGRPAHGRRLDAATCALARARSRGNGVGSAGVRHGLPRQREPHPLRHEVAQRRCRGARDDHGH